MSSQSDPHSAPYRQRLILPFSIYPACDVTGQFPRIAAGVGGCRAGRVWPRLPERTSILRRSPARLCSGRALSFRDSLLVGDAKFVERALGADTATAHQQGRNHRREFIPTRRRC